jgi:hypothetical protein
METRENEAANVPTILKKQFIQLDGRGPLPARANGASRTCGKDVRLVVLDGAVRALELTCSCGEVTLVELEFPSTPEANGD